MSNIKQIFKNISFNWVGVAVSMILGFVQAPIVVKGLGNTWFGIWVLVNQVVNYSWIFDLGIREAVMIHVSKHHKREEFLEINKIVSSAVYLYFFISLITLIVVSIVTALLPSLFRLDLDSVGVARLVLFLSGLNIAINWFFNSYVGVLMGLQRFDIFQKIGVSLGVVNFFLIITFIKFGYGIVALSLINFITSMVSNTLVYWNCRRLVPGLKLVRYDKNNMSIKPLVNYGKYVLLNHIGAKIIFGADAVIIGMFMQPSAITFYAIPGTLMNMLKNLISSSTRVMSPLFSALGAYDELEKTKIVFINATKLSCIVGLPVGIVFLFMGKNFISLWMGKSYSEGSGLVLMILTIGALLTICEHMIDSVLFGMSRHHTIAWLRVIEAAAKIILCIFFIESWGIVGVALGGTLAHIVFAGIIMPPVVCKSLNIKINTYMSQLIFLPFVSSIPFALCCYLLNLYLPAKNLAIFFLWIALIIPIFFVSAWFVVFTKPERKVFIGMVHSHVSIPRLFAKKKNLPT